MQLSAYGLLLAEHGHASQRAFIYFAESKTRVEVEFDAPRAHRLWRGGGSLSKAAMILPPARMSQ